MLKNGVPFPAAFGLGHDEAAIRLTRTERQAFCIVFSEFEGGEFDWELMEFKERK